MLNVLAGILKGYGGTMLDLEGKEAQQELERRRARLQIITQAIPNITDPSLHAEAISLAEELATGKGKKKGGLAGFLSALTGGQAGDIGQGEKLKEFMARPREATVRPTATAPGPGLPPIPGILPGQPTEVTIPAATGEVRGPFPTPTEQIQQRAALTEAEARAGAGVKGEVASREAQRLAAEARTIGLTNPADIANYVRGHMVIPTAITAVAGTVPGAALAGQLPTDTLGNPIDPNQDYRVTRRPDGTVASAYPASEATRVVAGDFTPDVESTTGFSRFLRDSRTGRNVGVQRNVLPPSGWAPTVSTTQSIRLVQQLDGTWVPVPVTSTTTRGKAVPGAEGTTLLPLPTAGGARVGQPGEPIGRKPLILGVKRDIANVKLALNFAAQVKAILDEPGPDGVPLSQRTTLDKQTQDWLKVRAEGALYSLGIRSNDPRYNKLNPLTSLLRVLIVSPYLKGLRNQLWVNQIQQHVPDATKHTPAAMAARLEVVTDALNKMQEDIMAQEGLSEEQWQNAAAQPAGPAATPTAKTKPAIPPEPKW